MTKMGRKSAEDRGSPILPGAPPPPPPGDLTEPEREIWSQITNTLPSDWISDTNAFLLRQLCRHVSNGDLLAVDISRCREEIAEARQRKAVTSEPKAKARERTQVLALERSLLRLLRAHGYESDHAMRLATKLKITMKSKYFRNDAAAAATARPVLRPWRDWHGGRSQ
jgi:hypothetical protein